MSVILAPIDGSERALRALPWAAKLAGPGGVVVLLQAVPPRSGVADVVDRIAGGDDERSAQEAAHLTASMELDAAAAAIERPGVSVERMVVAGEPEEEIVAAAVRRGADMIVMASRGRGAVGRAIFGSVADRVSRGATVPVFILRDDEDSGRIKVAIERILAPLDGSEIAERALPVAAALARQFAAPIHIVRAIDPVTMLPVAPGVFGATPVVTAEIADRIWKEAEVEAKSTVRDAVADLHGEGLEASGSLLTGSPFFAIIEAVRSGDLLVLTSHGRGGVRRWLLGSVAEKLVREAPVPVVLVPAAERVAGRES